MAIDVLDVPRARRACGRQHVRDRDQGESAEATRRVDLGVDPAAQDSQRGPPIPLYRAVGDGPCRNRTYNLELYAMLSAVRG